MATKKRKLGKFQLNKDLLMDAVIAAIVVQQVPPLINKFLFKSNPLSGIALTASGAAGAIVLGMLLKKPDLGTLGIAFAGSDILNGFIAPALNPGAPAGMSDFLTVLPNGQLALNDYIHAPGGIMNSNEYAKAYSKFN